MKAIRFIGLAAIGIAMLGADSALAEELPLPTDATTPREQLQERMRTMTPEEQRLMRETSSDRRTRMEMLSACGHGLGFDGGLSRRSLCCTFCRRWRGESS